MKDRDDTTTSQKLSTIPSHHKISAQPLVIGYGNPMRQDDGVGWHIACLLANDHRAKNINILARHQLTPELAEDLHQASQSILVDARMGGNPPLAPGCYSIEKITSHSLQQSKNPSLAGRCSYASRLSHHCTPQELAALSYLLFGPIAPVTVIGIGVSSVEEGEKLTPAVSTSLPSIIDLILGLGLSPHPL